MEPIFNIQNLECQYVAGKTVLHIPSLQIPRGELVFLIGPSGIGKSTMIETLGLMNKTIKPSKDVRVQFNPQQKEAIELHDIWQKDKDILADFRQQYFSFIFQNTNLMPNFSAGENMIIAALLNGSSRAKAKEDVLRAMEQINLDPDLYDRKITEVSGGQRQRLAFVRAIVGGFEVLFGDEPTGNLDRHNAYELMNVLKTLLVKQNKTGIIVSHDLQLALDYADRIIPITYIQKEGIAEEDRYGEILPKNLFVKQNGIWKSKVLSENQSTIDVLEGMLYSDSKQEI